MNVRDFAARVGGVSVSRTEGTSVAGIADIIALILPILLNLPCFKPKTAAEKREWIEDHPGLARNRAINAIRDNSPGLRRRDAAVIADQMLAHSSSLTDEQFAAVCASAGA